MRVYDLRKKTSKAVAIYFLNFESQSIFTWEGMSAERENLEAIQKGLKLSKATFYIYTGKQMNEAYGLTGNNAYPEELTFVSLENYYDPMVKLQVGARWFDDIVDNNRSRQNAIDGKDEEEE